MKLLDATDGIESTYPGTSEGQVRREVQKLKAADTEEKQLRRLDRIERIVGEDPSVIPHVIEQLSRFYTTEQQVSWRRREVFADCLWRIVEGKTKINPEHCAIALAAVADMPQPGDQYLLDAVEKNVLAEFPYAFSMHREALLRKSHRRQMPLADVHSVVFGASAALKTVGHKHGLELEKKGDISSRFCRDLDDLPPELMKLAALKEIMGDLPAALSIMRDIHETTKIRSFVEYASYLVHFRRMLLLGTLSPEVATRPMLLANYQSALNQIAEILDFITGGQNPDFPGTFQLAHMLEVHSCDDTVGRPINQRVDGFLGAFNQRVKKELLN